MAEKFRKRHFMEFTNQSHRCLKFIMEISSLANDFNDFAYQIEAKSENYFLNNLNLNNNN